MPSTFFTPVMAEVGRERSLQKTKTHVLQNSDLRSLLEEDDPHRPRFTGSKVIVTIGPATNDVETMCELLRAGMSCARFDLTFGTLDFHDAALANLNQARRLTGLTCAVMVDTLGRELLILNTDEAVNSNGSGSDDSSSGGLESSIPVTKGSRVVLTADQTTPASPERLAVNYPHLAQQVLVGDRLFVGRYLNTGSDGCSLFLTVTALEGSDVVCVAENDAMLSGLCTLVLVGEGEVRGTFLHELPLLSGHDEAALRALAGRYDVDYVAVSYACHGDDMEEMRTFLDQINMHNTKLICKLEHTQALHNFARLAGAADAFIISRGNLGLHVPCEKIALVQKQLVSQCNHLGKPVIITRIVDTMVNTPRPTRAEATDVANAILDGADGLLLGAETMRGKYPVTAVKTVLGICREAEAAFDHAEHYEYLIGDLVEADGGMKAALGSHGQLVSSPRGRHSNKSNFGSAVNLAQLGGGGGGGNAGGFGSSSYQSLSSLGRGLAKLNNNDATPIPHAISNASLTSAASSSPGRGQGSSAISLYKLEALASSAVRAVAKVQARLLICFGSTGRTASLIAKYRPPVPIYTVVVHKAYAGDAQHASFLSRQLHFIKGVVPVLAAPDAEENEGMLQDAIVQALQLGFIAPGDSVVCIMALRDNMVLKMVTVNEDGNGLCKVGSQSSIVGGGKADADARQPCTVGSLP